MPPSRATGPPPVILAHRTSRRRASGLRRCVLLASLVAAGPVAAQAPASGLGSAQDRCTVAEAAHRDGAATSRGPTCADLLAVHDDERAAADAALGAASVGRALEVARARYDAARAAYVAGRERGRGATCDDVLERHAREHNVAARRVAEVRARPGHDVTLPHPAAGPLPPCRLEDAGPAAAAACTAFLDALQRGGVRRLRLPPGTLWTHGVPMHDSLQVDGFGEAVVRLQADVPAERPVHGFFAADLTRPLRAVRLRGFTQEGLRRVRPAGGSDADTDAPTAPQHGLFVAAAEDLLVDASWTHNVGDGLRLGAGADGAPGRARRVRIVGGTLGWNGGSGLRVADADSLAVVGVTVRENQQRAGPGGRLAAHAQGAQIALAPDRPDARIHRVWIRDALVFNSVAGGLAATVRAPGASISAVTLDGLRLINDGSDARYAGRSGALVLASGNGSAAGPRAPIRDVVIRRVLIRGFGGRDGRPVIVLEGGTDRAVIQDVVLEALDADGRGYRSSGEPGPFLRARAVEGLLLRSTVLRSAGPAFHLDSAHAVLEDTRLLPAHGYQLDVEDTRPHVLPSVTVRGADSPLPARDDDTIRGAP